MAQAVMRRPITAKSRLRSRAISLDADRQNGSETGFCLSTSVLHVSVIPFMLHTHIILLLIS